MTEPGITIFLPTKNAGARLRTVLEAVFAQTGTEPFEVLAIDSGSRDDTLTILRQFPLRLEQIPPEAFGHGRTRNLGVHLARGDIVVCLSQDAQPANDHWLQRLVAPLAEEDIAGSYGRQLPWADTPLVQRYFLQERYPPEPAERVWPGHEPTQLQEIFFSNVDAALKRDIALRYPFDETLIMSEDQAWAKTVLQAGYRLRYVPQATVYHAHHYTLGSAFRRNFDSGYSLRGMVRNSFAVAFRDWLAYLQGEFALARRETGWRSWPGLALYEAARAAGFFLGSEGRFLPKWVRRRLSWHRAYWDRAGT